ncbi:hypothetical protein [Fibrobacter sp. UBA4297]|uniref:hypothetical protein n=1 Tax=Fibrobacter sp. UBA4297 TaxID=1946536 RepID=UPI0025BDC749|nr:hypothetical protein [Fibrobacter sp. UBA4297]
MVFRRILWIVLLVAAMLAGCSVAIIHPPSASAFMEKSKSSFIGNASLTVTLGDIAYGKKDEFYIAREKVGRIENEDWSYSAAEWPIEFSVSLQRIVGYFKYGLGLDFITPYVQAGFVSDYFGVMGWSNLWVWQLEKVEHKYFQWGGGVSIIEQLPIGKNVRIGLTQHWSRNGREDYTYGDAIAFGIPMPMPIFYDEIGGGGYVSFPLMERLRVGVEFRYGRDLTYKQIDFSKKGVVGDMNRYSIVVDLQGW